MAWGMFLAIPCPCKRWDERARQKMLVCLPLVGLVVGGVWAVLALLLRGAPVLLLDEATSALDVATERRVLRSLMQSHPNKTCIVTTHRPTVIGLCERVYQVGGGTVRELGKQEAQALAMEF